MEKINKKIALVILPILLVSMVFGYNALGAVSIVSSVKNAVAILTKLVVTSDGNAPNGTNDRIEISSGGLFLQNWSKLWVKTTSPTHEAQVLWTTRTTDLIVDNDATIWRNLNVWWDANIDGDLTVSGSIIASDIDGDIPLGKILATGQDGNTLRINNNRIEVSNTIRNMDESVFIWKESFYVNTKYNLVWIWTSNPSNELSVSGNVWVAGGISVDWDTFYVNNATKSVWIWTTVPAERFHVNWWNILVSNWSLILSDNILADMNDNTFFVNSTTNKVWIWTLNPSKELEVSWNVLVWGGINSNTLNSTSWTIGNFYSTKWTIGTLNSTSWTISTLNSTNINTTNITANKLTVETIVNKTVENITVSGSLYPSETLKYDLWSNLLKWKNVYANNINIWWNDINNIYQRKINMWSPCVYGISMISNSGSSTSIQCATPPENPGLADILKASGDGSWLNIYNTNIVNKIPIYKTTNCSTVTVSVFSLKKCNFITQPKNNNYNNMEVTNNSRCMVSWTTAFLEPKHKNIIQNIATIIAPSANAAGPWSQPTAITYSLTYCDVYLSWYINKMTIDKSGNIYGWWWDGDLYMSQDKIIKPTNAIKIDDSNIIITNSPIESVKPINAMDDIYANKWVYLWYSNTGCNTQNEWQIVYRNQCFYGCNGSWRKALNDECADTSNITVSNCTAWMVTWSQALFNVTWTLANGQWKFYTTGDSNKNYYAYIYCSNGEKKIWEQNSSRKWCSAWQHRPLPDSSWCVLVSTWYYSASGDYQQHLCSSKPSNSSFSGPWGATETSCPWTCNSWYQKSWANSCVPIPTAYCGNARIEWSEECDRWSDNNEYLNGCKNCVRDNRNLNSAKTTWNIWDRLCESPLISTKVYEITEIDTMWMWHRLTKEVYSDNNCMQK